MAHALTGLGMAAIASGVADVLPAVAGMLVFALLAAWFLTVLLRGGGPHNPARAGRIHGQGGYTLHHLAACGAMIYLFAAGPGGLSNESSAVPSYSAAAADNAVAVGHYSLSAGTNVSWLFGLYFLVAATSLGFRVVEPAVRVTHRPAVSNGLLAYSPAPRSASVKLLGTPAGLCASEVMLSAGLAFVFFSAL